MALKHEPVELAIIGAGAAGLFAAATAQSRGIKCVVIERKARIGAKMLMTANGRCNFTKDITAAEMLSDIGGEVAKFVRQAVEECPPKMILGGFRARGLKTKRMMDGRLFPASEKAADVVHIFGDLLRDNEIPLLTNCPVTGLQPVKNGFIVATRNFTLWAKNVLVATGGLSFPKTGSVGDGQRFARELGLRVEPCRAGLTGFDVQVPSSYVSAPPMNAHASVYIGSRLFCSYTGEVEFDPRGITGAAVYNCQRRIARDNIRNFTIVIETNSGRIEFENPKSRQLKEAIVTIGGVSLDEIDPSTMQSLKHPGLYFAGEVLDIDGPTGGYNLSLAFVTARLAVRKM